MAKPTPLENFKKVLHRHYLLSDDTVADVVFGVCFANRLDADPTWLFLVGPPSCGKTIMLDPIQGHSSIVSLSKMTKNSLVSGWKDPRKKSKTPKGGFSLLNDLDGKILALKDFTTMLSMRKDDLKEILGELREAYDGSVSRKFGNDALTTIYADFGIIAAVTNAIDQYRGTLADLGERFLTFRMPEATEREQQRRSIMAAKSRNKKVRKSEMQKAAHAVLDMTPEVATVCDAHLTRLSRIAAFAAKARANVRRHSYTKEAEYAHAEYPQRLTIQLANFAAGVAMARGKKRATNLEVNLACKMAIESVTYKRLQLMRHILTLRTATISSLLKVYPFSKTQVSNDVEDLRILNLLDISNQLGENRHIVKAYSLKNEDSLRWILFGE